MSGALKVPAWDINGNRVSIDALNPFKATQTILGTGQKTTPVATQLSERPEDRISDRGITQKDKMRKNLSRSTGGGVTQQASDLLATTTGG